MNESKDSVKGKLNAAKEAFEELHQLYMTKKNEHFYNLHKMENKQRKIYLGHLKNENSDSFIYFFIRNIYLASSPLLDYSSLHAK